MGHSFQTWIHPSGCFIQWIKRYYSSNEIKVFPKQCFPKEKATDFKNKQIVLGQDNNQYMCIKRDVYLKFGKTENKPTVYSYWKRHGFNFDRKLPHIHAREQEEGYEHLGNDGETLYVIVLSNNGISDSPYKKWELKHKNVKNNCPSEDPTTLEIGTVTLAENGIYYKVNNKNKWLRMRKQPTAVEPITETPVVEEAVVKKSKKSKKSKKTDAEPVVVVEAPTTSKKKSKKSKKSTK